MFALRWLFREAPFELVFIVVSAICIVVAGITPDQWIAEVIQSPPIWLTSWQFRLAIIIGGFVSIFFWLSKALNKPKRSKPNWNHWDNVISFYLWEAAYLWNNEEPPPRGMFRKETLDENRKREEVYVRMRRAAESGALQNAGQDGSYILTRQGLENFCEKVGETPKFLKRVKQKREKNGAR